MSSLAMPRRAKSPDEADPAPPPDRSVLRQAALAHLARYAATEAGLLRVLERRIDRWARACGPSEPGSAAVGAASARDAARKVVAELAAEGAVSDKMFAQQRALRLIRGGRSRQAVAAHLAARGVQRETAQEALVENPRQELAAALLLARRRRIGPFRAGPTDTESRVKELGILARAGFSRAIAEQALATDAADADSLVAWLRRG